MHKQNHAKQFNLNKQAKIRLIVSIAISQALVGNGLAYALPTGAEVQYGQSTIQTNVGQMQIHQATQKSIINWQSFGIAAGESVQLLQPAQGMALYRVIGPEASQIFGSLNATGSLFLINPNGVLFGQGAQVDVGGLVASTLNISNTDFLGGNYHFNAGSSPSGVMNQGTIRAADGGYVVMLGNEVVNSGNITANQGSIVLGSAQSAMLDFYGNGLIRTRLSGDALNALVEQSGHIQADGGTVQLATSARSSAINVSGIVQANSLVERNGVIRLEGGDHARVSVSGTLSAAGNGAGTTGGRVEVTGEQVALFKGADLDASGYAGGGTVLVGGDYQGKNTQAYNARTTYVDKDASIHADAVNSGNGGTAVVWSNDTTRYYGNITARGGAQGGNGGFVEVSGKQNLDFIGKVDLSASHGIGGKFLLDPTNITLNTSTQASPPNNPNGTPDLAFGDGPANTIVQISDITGYSEAFFQATNDITIASTLTMGANNSIRLEANNNINLNAAVTVSGTGNINFKADADNSGTGNLAIGANITSREGGITLSGATITRTAGNIASTGAANANAGNISITSTGTTNLGTATITANGGAASAGNAGRNGGAITINAGGFTGTGAISASGSNGNGANMVGGNAGSITINSSNGISMGAATASGGNAGTGNASGGSAGAININNSSAGNITTGTLISRTGNAIGTGAGGTAAGISVTNNATSGNVSTGALSTQGGTMGHGGNIALSALGNVSVSSTVSSSGGTSLAGNAGRNAGTVNINAGGNAVTGAITASGSAGVGTNQNGGNAGVVTLTAGIGNTITHNSITASGGARTGTGIGGNGANVTINGNSLLSANTTIAALGAAGGGASGNVSFGGTVNSSGANRTLAVNTGAATTFGGAVGNILALASLTTDAGGTTAINGGSVTTTGTQTYNDAAALGAATSLATTNSNITFANSVNASGNALTMASGTGNITATNAANNFSSVAISSANNVSLRDANAIVLGTSNISGTFGLQTAGAITQTGAATVGGTTTLNAGAANDITLNNAFNNFNAVAITSGRDVTLVDANALTMNGSSVRTLSARTLSNNLTLGGTITATGTGAGTSITLAAAQNFLNPGNFNLTPGVGSRWLVYSASPLSDTRGANLLAAYDFKQYNTAFGGPILGSNDGFIYSLAPTITATLSGSASKVYDGTTTAAISGLTLGQSGAIDGDTVNLSALTSAAYDNKNVGVSKTVTSNTISVTSASNGAKPVYGYQVSGSAASGNVGTITQRAITVTAATDIKTYDGNTSSVGAPTVTSGSIVAGDTGSFSQAFDNRNAGTGKTLTATGSVNDGNSGNNYAVTFVADNTGVINQRAISITANPGQNKIVGTVDPVFTYTVGGLGLVGGDTLTGALARAPGETVGGYAFNLGTLDAGTNYIITFNMDNFSILASPTSQNNGGNAPRDVAGLGGLLTQLDTPMQHLAVLNVAAPGAGNEVGDNAETCQEIENKRLNNPNTSVIFNFGIHLPAGVMPECTSL
ncbi:MAG TPA: filamentous hemagglutinin N-terminal domain-containing protein [Methylophilus sp.]|nr:filamentous hemagglutinin N-terminal domain-containing protein [Methylophilus sp.]HQQ32354.1 filamentous hemagglutinin N-terminal domain-containing protein [Methylophilus sp.]